MDEEMRNLELEEPIAESLEASALTVFHRTAAATAVLANGFRNAGVLVSDQPLDSQEGAHGVDLIEIDLPDGVFEEYEWVDAAKTYREALIPAAILNQYPRRLVQQ